MRVMRMIGMIGVLVALGAAFGCGGSASEEEVGQDSAGEVTATALSGPCEIIWAKISNADARDERDQEARLKERARELECFIRPETVPEGEYPDAEDLPTP